MGDLFAIALVLLVTSIAAWLWGGSLLPLLIMVTVFWAVCCFAGGFSR